MEAEAAVRRVAGLAMWTSGGGGAIGVMATTPAPTSAAQAVTYGRSVFMYSRTLQLDVTTRPRMEPT